MYIYDSVVTLEKQEIEISSGYPKEIIVLDEDAITGLLIPSHVRVISFTPIPNKKLTIDTAENGYIVKHGTKTVIVKNSTWDDDLLKTIDNLLNHEVETERELSESESESDKLTEQLETMNEEYQALKE